MVCFVIMGSHLYVPTDPKLSIDTCCLAFAVILMFYGKFHSRVLVLLLVVRCCVAVSVLLPGCNLLRLLLQCGGLLCS
jgi:hypothetical protein